MKKIWCVSHPLKEYTSLQQYGGTGCTSAKTATTEIATEMGAEPKFKASFTKRKIKDKVKNLTAKIVISNVLSTHWDRVFMALTRRFKKWRFTVTNIQVLAMSRISKTLKKKSEKAVYFTAYWLVCHSHNINGVVRCSECKVLWEKNLCISWLSTYKPFSLQNN